jgi:hypothetical protein
MKTKLAMLTALFLVLSLMSFAATSNSEMIRFEQPVKVAGTQVAPGEYHLVWEGTGPEVQVSFMRGKKTVVTASARVVEQPNAEKAIITNREGGSKELLSVLMKKMSLVFSESNPGSGK